MDSLLEISISSGQKTWPGRAAILRRISLASRGERASGMARWFEETRTNPDWVTEQVANPARPTSSNQASAVAWWTWFGQANATRTLTSRRIAVAFDIRRTSGLRRETNAGLEMAMRLLVLERRVNHFSRHGSSVGGHVESRKAAPGPSRRKRHGQALARQIRDDGSESPSPRRSQTAGSPVDVFIEVKCGSDGCAHEDNMML